MFVLLIYFLYKFKVFNYLMILKNFKQRLYEIPHNLQNYILLNRFNFLSETQYIKFLYKLTFNLLY